MRRSWKEVFASRTFAQDSDEEIDPNEIDIGFHDEPTASPPPAVQQATPSSPEPGKGPPTPTEEPHKEPQGGETNFFAQPGILAGDCGCQLSENDLNSSGLENNMLVGHTKIPHLMPPYNVTFGLVVLPKKGTNQTHATWT